MKTAFIHCAELDKHPYPASCPFNTGRAGLTRSMLASMQLLSDEDSSEVAPEPAPREAMEAFHTTAYLDALQNAEEGQLSIDGLMMGIGGPDNPVFHGLNEYAILACGATLKGMELVLDGEADIAFNPSGGYHHAGPRKASGFCYINDVAIACMLLARAGRRVLYIDIDAHHGDGVQDAFYERRDVLTISIHESGRTLFPGTGFPSDIGAGEGEGYAINVPMPVGAYDEVYLDAFRQIVPPLAGAFAPDVVVMELGMDGLAGDPLAHMRLTNNAHAEILATVMGFGRPILAVGGGGYHVENTARGWALLWSIMCGENPHEGMGMGLGGVLLESTDWQGGLRDRTLIVEAEMRAAVAPLVQEAVDAVRRDVFPVHGL